MASPQFLLSFTLLDVFYIKGSPGAKGTGSCQPPDLSRLKSGLLEEKEALLATEPSLQPLHLYLYYPSSHTSIDSIHSSLYHTFD